jgi:hypothetical protein
MSREVWKRRATATRRIMAATGVAAFAFVSESRVRALSAALAAPAAAGTAPKRNNNPTPLKYLSNLIPH